MGVPPGYPVPNDLLEVGAGVCLSPRLGDREVLLQEGAPVGGAVRQVVGQLHLVPLRGVEYVHLSYQTGFRFVLQDGPYVQVLPHTERQTGQELYLVHPPPLLQPHPAGHRLVGRTVEDESGLGLVS